MTFTFVFMILYIFFAGYRFGDRTKARKVCIRETEKADRKTLLIFEMVIHFIVVIILIVLYFYWK